MRQHLALFFLGVFSSQSAIADVSELNLSGEWWCQSAALKPADVYLPSSKSHLAKDWQKITIPNNWYLAGLDFSGPVWHKKSFNLDKKQLNQQAFLQFKAVDYAADVWLNGQYLGYHQGYFEPFGFDVSGLLKQTDNLLVVRVDSPYEPVGDVWSLHKQLIKGVLNHHDTRPAGAWSVNGQDANSGGIWQEPIIHFSDKLAVKQFNIEAILPTTPLPEVLENVALKLKLHVATQEAIPLRIRATIEQLNGSDKKSPIQFTIHPEQLQKLSTEQYLLEQDIDLQKIKTWWPLHYGEAAVYRIKLDIFDENKQLLEQVSQRFALRTVHYDQRELAFFINGKRFFIKGTNYIASPWLASMNRERYSQDLQLMQQAHINAIRVHAHVAGQDLYDIADELGMLIWQDFPLQWGYDDSEAFATEAARQAQAMLDMLQQHPSVFAWSGHNEPPWNAPWMKYKYPNYKPQQNRLLTAMVAGVLANDHSRYNHDYSATDEHLWMGWYSGNWRDHGKRTKVSIVSEFGAQALPDVNVLKTIIPAADLWPKSLDPQDPAWQSWDYHNFQVNETFKIVGIDRGNSIESFVQNSQQYQAKLTQLAAESYRRQRYQPVAAIFQFMFNETWPSINWGVVDYTRQPKQGYWALKQAYQPILPSIEWDNDKIKRNETARFVLWSINDTWQNYPALTLQYKLWQDKQLIEQNSKTINVIADQGQPEWELKWSNLAAGNYRLEANIVQKKQILGTNQFNFVVESGKP